MIHHQRLIIAVFIYHQLGLIFHRHLARFVSSSSLACTYKVAPANWIDFSFRVIFVVGQLLRSPWLRASRFASVPGPALYDKSCESRLSMILKLVPSLVLSRWTALKTKLLFLYNTESRQCYVQGWAVQLDVGEWISNTLLEDEHRPTNRRKRCSLLHKVGWLYST